MKQIFLDNEFALSFNRTLMTNLCLVATDRGFLYN